MSPKTVSYLFCSVLLLASLLSVFAVPARAQTGSRQGLSVTPLRREVEIAAGTSFMSSLSLTNNGQTPLTVEMSAESFGVINQAYDYRFDESSPESKWVTFSPASVDLKQGESREIEYTIGVPVGAEAGGHYLSFFASSRPSELTTGIDPLERIASLVYVTVPGDISRTGALLDLQTPSVVLQKGTWSATIQNSGSTHFRSVYNITLQSLFGKSISSYENTALILPGSVRLVSNTTPTPQWIGLYKVDYSIGLGDSPAVKSTHWFLYLPPVQLGVLLAFIALFITYRVYRHNRNKRIKTAN
ncbi:MAG: exported protein of unknown function [Candidatus Saccharibacteria bacterium]|nr:exported protein of unknown function [Candidatus Saccharibacteria bacterium]